MQYSWPESFEEEYEHYHLPDNLKNVLVLSDAHIPYHDIGALDEAINYGIVKKIDSILLNGDILDCYMLSKFQPDPRNRNFAEEIIATQQFIKVLKDAFPDAKIYFKRGNHEERYEKFMIVRCAEFLRIPSFDFENVLGLRDLGVNVVKDQKIVYAGKLPIFHGHELQMKAVSVNPARTLFLKVHTSAVCSHLHRTSQHTEPSLNEDITCWSTGHLGDAHPKYARINKWNHGCCRIEKDEIGNYEVINVNLTKNKLFLI
jgi:predicted phosphodiesterase